MKKCNPETAKISSETALNTAGFVYGKRYWNVTGLTLAWMCIRTRLPWPLHYPVERPPFSMARLPTTKKPSTT